MQCNIKRGGRIARAISGIICISVGSVLPWIGWPEAVFLRWAVAALAIAAGLFQLFEARRGWCVMRAMGFKTPM